MSTYELNRFCHLLTVDGEHRARAQRDPVAALEAFDVTDEEAGAVASGDIGFLLAHGVHPLLLVRLHQFGVAGLDEAEYSARARAIGGAGP